MPRQAIPRPESIPFKYPIGGKPEVDPRRKAAVCGPLLERYAAEKYLSTRYTQELSGFSAPLKVERRLSQVLLKKAVIVSRSSSVP